MPIKKVGKDGYQWGTHGHIYRGKDAKKRAQAQARAAYANGYKGK